MPINYIANKQPNTCALTCAFAGPRRNNQSLYTYTHDHKPPGMFVTLPYAKPHAFTRRQHITAQSLRLLQPPAQDPQWDADGAVDGLSGRFTWAAIDDGSRPATPCLKRHVPLDRSGDPVCPSGAELLLR